MGDQTTAQRTLNWSARAARPACPTSVPVKCHPTEAESLLWQHLRRSRLLGRKFRRQEPIGPYIVDFICFDPMLVIEIDGSQHTGLIAYDAERSSFLGTQRLQSPPFLEHEVLAQTHRVREAIRQSIEELMGSPTPSPPPLGGGITHWLADISSPPHGGD